MVNIALTHAFTVTNIVCCGSMALKLSTVTHVSDMEHSSLMLKFNKGNSQGNCTMAIFIEFWLGKRMAMTFDENNIFVLKFEKKFLGPPKLGCSPLIISRTGPKLSGDPDEDVCIKIRYWVDSSRQLLVMKVNIFEQSALYTKYEYCTSTENLLPTLDLHLIPLTLDFVGLHYTIHIF